MQDNARQQTTHNALSFQGTNRAFNTELELELELILSHMTQKPMLRGEMGACALRNPVVQHRGDASRDILISEDGRSEDGGNRQAYRFFRYDELSGTRGTCRPATLKADSGRPSTLTRNACVPPASCAPRRGTP